MIIYFDTETTGLRPGNICQLSYILQDESGIKAKNMFFSVDFVEYGAYAVHGFSVEKLKVLSNGERFIDRLKEINEDFSNAKLIVSHNFSFDCSFLREEFLNCNSVFTYNESFCSMKAMTPVCKLKRSSSVGYKYPKLSELCAYFNISDREILENTKNLFGADVGYHDARFDTTAVYLACNRGMQTESGLYKLKSYL